MGRTAMNTKRAIKWSLLVAAAGGLAVASMPGCELLVTFDRSKIPDDGGSADATESDGAFNPDAVSSETGPASDGQVEPAQDGQAEASTSDAPSDAGTADAPATTADSSTPDTGAGGTDSSVDTGTDAGVGTDAAVDSGVVDAPADSAGNG